MRFLSRRKADNVSSNPQLLALAAQTPKAVRPTGGSDDTDSARSVTTCHNKVDGRSLFFVGVWLQHQRIGTRFALSCSQQRAHPAAFFQTPVAFDGCPATLKNNEPTD
jgi:hypothetical protein